MKFVKFYLFCSYAESERICARLWPDVDISKKPEFIALNNKPDARLEFLVKDFKKKFINQKWLVFKKKSHS